MNVKVHAISDSYMALDWQKETIIHISEKKMVSKFKQKAIWNNITGDENWFGCSSDIIKKIIKKKGLKTITISKLEQLILMFLKQKALKEKLKNEMPEKLKEIKKKNKVTSKKDDKKEHIYRKEKKVSINFSNGDLHIVEICFNTYKSINWKGKKFDEFY